MIEHIIVSLLFFCALGQFLYILRMKKQEKQWVSILRSNRYGNKQKIFVNDIDLMEDIGYELNAIIESYSLRIEQLEKADEANKQILTSLSHDVRTPLASLLGYLEAFHNGIVLEEEERQYIEIAYRKANDLKSYIDMLFQWFKLNSNEQKFNFKKEDINERTREIIIDWIPIFEKQSISFKVDISEEQMIVKLDPMAYRRILNNLFQNAINHGKGNFVSVSIKRKEDSCIIEIMNNGQSIPSEQLSYIFDRSYKCDGARSDKGSGLGLAITKELVNVHKGKISVKSSLDSGTVFSIVFPCVN
ncbi:HAMP domain-containing histidine kinase [Clostridium sp. D2Q-14]|uniref:sensor histidine kinase n=1 Tax=Anaeromonas gelatinilytica TaxID=2683194 RepID=UPI00193B4BF7|nr:HAMP domain-containing sensor histidine kinase [Anaeromonas gelatinilytica]MBS4536298.1 HAMP domain-containing histidine kinase [Anaeromonas gelatinilytica]